MGRIQAMIDPNRALKHYKMKVLLKIGGTSTKKKVKSPLFNDFCVPLQAWDKPGTTAGHGTSQDKKEAAETASHPNQIGRLPDDACILSDHLVAGFAAPGFCKLGHV